MITTLLYDMDGLLLDTEPLWGECMMAVAQRHGIAMTPERLRATTGLRIYEVCDHWAEHYPWQGSTATQVATEILDDVIRESCVRGGILPGIEQSLKAARSAGLKTAVATSSPARMMDTLLETYCLRDYFDGVYSADAVQYGKPHPAVFLHAAAELGTTPSQCCVLEDSVNGMIAAKAARMKVIVVPNQLHFDDPRFALADAKLRTMEDFDVAMLNVL